MSSIDEDLVVGKSPGGFITLTKETLRLESKISGQTRLISMTLDSVASCGLVTRSYPLLILIAVLLIIIGILFITYSEPLIGSGTVLVGLFLILIYFSTRSAQMVFSSAGESIEIKITSSDREPFLTFIDLVEQTKISYLKNLQFHKA